MRDGARITDRQRIGVCTTSDGAKIAYSTAGRGPPLVWTGSWFTHLELDWDSPVWRHWIQTLAARHRLVRYDLRGTGLSDPDVGHADIDTWVDDLDAVVDDLGLTSFPLLGVCQGGPIAVAYAARRPERVSRLVLFGGYVRGAFAADAASEAARRARAIGELIQLGWGRGDRVFREVAAKMLMPDVPPEKVEFMDEVQRKAASPANAARLWEAFHSVDVREHAARVRVPTLVVHVRGDVMVPVAEGERLASAISGAELVTLEGANHVLMENDVSWPRFVEELFRFLGCEGPDGPQFPDLTPREREILRLVARGLANADIARDLGLREKTVRNYVSIIIDKLGVDGRPQAIVEAREAGLR
jgi:pimeloyl-ACP methyl ester carboxylesterase/DNA-binding CsgD family transcriptional regulator